jgi:hypothetical protein
MTIFINERILLTGEDWIPTDSIEIENTLSNLIRSLYYFNFYTEPVVYYSAKGLTDLINNFNLLESYSDYFLTNPIDRLRTVLNEIDAVDWNLKPKQRNDYSYYFLSGGGALTHYVNNSSVAEATECRYSDACVALLNLINSEFNETNPLHVSRSSISPPPNIQTVGIEVIKTKSEIIGFVNKNRKKRTYNWNPKHGENGKGMIQTSKRLSPPWKVAGSRLRHF